MRTVPTTALAAGVEQVRSWARPIDETRVVFTTMSGSTYVFQSRNDHLLLRQLDGDTLRHLFGTLCAETVVHAWSELDTGRTHIKVQLHDGTITGLVTSRAVGAAAA